VRSATTVIIGGGHAGLAMSRQLSDRSIDHVVLERGEVANSWRTERWDSLRLLTPNWLSRLPGHEYQGEDPHGFASMAEITAFIDGYARVIDAPLQTQTVVTSVRAGPAGYALQSNQGEWSATTVVLATGACNLPKVPDVAAAVPPNLTCLTPMQYRNADQLDEGGVLVVGASATGLQLAHELAASGRAVTMAVGEHVRAPRTYRGRDILWWMDGAGVLDERYDEVDDIRRARNVPSAQLVGTPERMTLDLNTLRGMGVRFVGRFAAVRDGVAQFSGSLRNVCALADLKMGRLLDTIDEWALASGLDAEVDPPYRPEPTEVDASPPLELDLRTGEISTILWATGYRPDYSWLDVPVIDSKARLRHDGGVVDAPGLYVVGLPFLRRRRSSFIDGACADTADLAGHLASYLDRFALAD
jgi:putative flavoprotein involved in K+ transport